MNSYEILGVRKDASQREIQIAYERKVAEIKRDVENKANAEAFINVLDKAYNTLIQGAEKIEKDSIENTVIMNPVEVNTYLNEVTSKEDGQATGNNIDSTKNKIKNTYKNNSINKANKSKINNNTKKQYGKSENQKIKKVKTKEKKDSLIIRILKIMLYPIITVLSIIIFICKIISMIMWLLSKALIIGSIAIVSIHCYQIYSGDSRNIKIFLLAALIMVVSLILPYIIKVLPKFIENINNGLKKFAFN